MTRKAVAKRIKITKSGEMLYHKAGQNHFNAKESRRIQHRRKKMQRFIKSVEKKVRSYL